MYTTSQTRRRCAGQERRRLYAHMPLTLVHIFVITRNVSNISVA